MSSKIQLLSDKTINQIAAGEVIENPASVVKELVENSIDAGAKQIRVECLDGGFTLIKVIDDGIGMSVEDARLCFQRHATSKLKGIEDLQQILSMGFRGEALASIASIAKVILITSLGSNALGSKVMVKAGKDFEIEKIARARGTTIEIRSLFYNVPARKKFQKSAVASQSEITKLMIKFALGFPHIGFTLMANQQQIVSTQPSSGEFLPMFKEACIHNLGKEFVLNCKEVTLEGDDIAIHGFVGLPSATRKNKTGQYLFINHRYVVSEVVSDAIKESYFSAIDSKEHPIYALHLTIDPAKVDVNVHPQKKHVRFEDDFYIKTKIQEALSSLMGAPKPFSVSMPSFKSPAFEKIPEQKAPTFPNEGKRISEKSYEAKLFPMIEEDIPLLFLFGSLAFMSAKDFNERARFHYLDCDSGMIVVDILQLRYLFYYQQMMQCLMKKEMGFQSQKLMFPLTVHLEPEKVGRLKHQKDLLSLFGVEAEFCASDTIEIHSLSEIVGENTLQQLLEDLSTFDDEREFEQSYSKKMQELAYLVLRRLPSKEFTLEVVKKLLGKYLNDAYGVYSPFNKPILVHLSQNAFESIFKTYQQSIRVDETKLDRPALDT